MPHASFDEDKWKEECVSTAFFFQKAFQCDLNGGHDASIEYIWCVSSFCFYFLCYGYAYPLIIYYYYYISMHRAQEPFSMSTRTSTITNAALFRFAVTQFFANVFIKNPWWWKKKTIHQIIRNITLWRHLSVNSTFIGKSSICTFFLFLRALQYRNSTKTEIIAHRNTLIILWFIHP